MVRAPKDAAAVRFGCTVTIAPDDGRRESYRIVGEDEADVAACVQEIMAERSSWTGSAADLLRVLTQKTIAAWW